MLLQTNSYIVPKEKRSEHARLLRKFRQTLRRLGCDHFEVYEQVGANWSGAEATGRFVQIMRFRDRKHQQEIQAAERQDPVAQQLISEFCAMINFPYQQQQGLFAVGFYRSALPVASPRTAGPMSEGVGSPGAAPSAETTAGEAGAADAGGAPSPREVGGGAEGASLLDIGAMAPAEALADVPSEAQPERSNEASETVPEIGEPSDDDEVVNLEGLTFDDPEHPEQPPRENTPETQSQTR